MEPKQRILEELKRRQLLEKQRRQQEKYKIGNRIQTVGNIVKKLPDAINKTQETINNIKALRSTPSLITPETTTNALSSTLQNATSANGTPALNNTNALSGAIKTATTANNVANTASTAGQVANTVASNVGKAMPVVGAVTGGASAVNNFAKGNHVDGALDIAKTGAMFIPGVGWAISGAIQIGQMIKNALNKKKQQEQQKNMQRMAENNALAEQKKQENLALFDQSAQANNTMPNQNMLAGPTSPVDTQVEQNILEQPQTPVVEAPNVTEDLGQVTGPASSVNQGYAGTLPEVNQQPLPEEDNVEFPLIQITDEDQESNDVKQNIINSVKSKLANVPSNLSSGLNDFIAGYKDNTQTSLSQGDLVNNLTKPKAEPKQLEDGTFDLSADETKKGLMTRLGEMVGTGQRIASHPLTQAGIAGLVSKASGGDIDDIAKAMYDYGSKKAEADRYYQMTTGKNDRPFFNTYNADDYKTQVQKDNWQKEFDWKVAKDARDFELEKEYRKAMAKYYENGGLRGNSKDRLAFEQQKFDKNLQMKVLEAKYKADLDRINAMEDYGQVEDGKNWRGKPKYRNLTKDELIKQVNDDYNKQLQVLINGEDPLGVL